MSEKVKNITALDGRYASKIEELKPIFSEFGLLNARVKVECQWLQFLSKELGLFKLDKNEIGVIDSISTGFDVSAANKIKEIEATTNHDVKAVEYYIKDQLEANDLGKIKEWVHFACTSEDINNLSYCLMLKDGRGLLLNETKQLLGILEAIGQKYKEIPMMARTHGQPATPTTVGKEFINFAWRIKDEIKEFEKIGIEGKINGATGSFNAHFAAFPKVDWINKSQIFLNNYLNVKPLKYTTQINTYSYISKILHSLIRLSSIMIDLDRDMWQYISLNYLKQKLKEGEIGSSTMPHKVNPIDFENGEGNFGLGIALMEHMAVKLLNSRMQRDLTDSTVLRNLGTAFGYYLTALKSTIKGLGKIDVNIGVIDRDLDENWELLAEPIQTVMRVYGESNPYEKLKSLTRGAKVTQKDLADFIDALESLPDKVKKELKNFTPHNYIGLAVNLVDQYFKERS